MFRSELPSLRVCIFNLPCLAFCRVRRELLEHLGYTFVQVLFVLIGLIRHCVLRTSAPDQLLGVCVVQVDNQGSYFVVLFGRGGVAEPSTSESSPSPSPTEAVIKRLKASLGLGRLNCYDCDIAATVHLGPT